MWTTRQLVQESNRIEGILREPTIAEITEHDRFTTLKEVTIEDLQRFAYIYQPDAVLRKQPGSNVCVGEHAPPGGGHLIPHYLNNLLIDAHKGHKALNAWRIHNEYEYLHPFTDCNGRTGRALWHWMMGDAGRQLGFLHRYYYQTLRYLQR
jgi:hypothetical protein